MEYMRYLKKQKDKSNPRQKFSSFENGIAMRFPPGTYDESLDSVILATILIIDFQITNSRLNAQMVYRNIVPTE